MDPEIDWIFIGDGKNDVEIAKLAPLSFGINAHEELAKIVTYNISSFEEIYEIIYKYENIIYLSEASCIDYDKSEHAEDKNAKYTELLHKLDIINTKYDIAVSALDYAKSGLADKEANIIKKENLLKEEIQKRAIEEENRRRIEAA